MAWDSVLNSLRTVSDAIYLSEKEAINHAIEFDDALPQDDSNHDLLKQIHEHDQTSESLFDTVTSELPNSMPDDVKSLIRGES